MGLRLRSPESPPRLREVARAQSRPRAAPPDPLCAGTGCLGPSALPSFPAVGALPVVLTRNRPWSSPQSTSPSPPLRGPAGCSPVRASRPRPAGVCGCLSAASPASLGALVSVLLPLPQPFPGFSRHLFLPDSSGRSAPRLRPPPSPVPPSPRLPVGPLHGSQSRLPPRPLSSSVCGRGGEPGSPSRVASFVCSLPSVRSGVSLITSLHLRFSFLRAAAPGGDVESPP